MNSVPLNASFVFFVAWRVECVVYEEGLDWLWYVEMKVATVDVVWKKCFMWCDRAERVLKEGWRGREMEGRRTEEMNRKGFFLFFRNVGALYVSV